MTEDKEKTRALITRQALDTHAERDAFLEFVPPCHPEAKMKIIYAKWTGVLGVFCCECKEMVSAIYVAAKPPKPSEIPKMPTWKN